MEMGLMTAIFLFIFIAQFGNMIYVIDKSSKSGSQIFFTPSKPKIELNSFGILPTMLIITFFCPLYITGIASCLWRSQMKGGFFIRQNMNYFTTMYLIIFGTSVWFLLCPIFWLIDNKLIHIFGGSCVLNGLSTLMAAIWLYFQKQSYEGSMSQIWWENHHAGRQLSRQQAHVIFELQKHKRIVANPVLYGGFDRYGKPTPHYLRAIQTNQYYEMQKSIHELESISYTPIEIIQNKHNEMVVKCKSYLLK